MTPQEALALVARALPSIPTDLKSHMALHEAVKILGEAIGVPKKK